MRIIFNFFFFFARGKKRGDETVFFLLIVTIQYTVVGTVAMYIAR